MLLNVLVAEGDKVVLYSTFNSTHTEENSDGFAPTGEAVEATGVATFIIEDGKIVDEPWSCWNHPARHQQLARAAVQLFVEKVWNDGDLKAADLYIAPDYVRHDPAAPEDVQGLDDFKEMVTMYRTAFPDLHLNIEDIIAGGDKGETVAVRWSSTGTHQGELMGIPATGNQVQITGIVIARIEGGQNVEAWIQNKRGAYRLYGSNQGTIKNVKRDF